MAKKVGVNPNTIMRTYSELQSDQIIENKRGIGYFVKPEAKKIILERNKADFFNKVIPEVIRQSELLGITKSELKKHLDQMSNT